MPAKYKYIFSNATQGTLALKDEPINWESLTLNFKRSEVLEGVTKSFTQDLTFHGDGREYIKAVYEDEGINGNIEVTVQILNFDTYIYEDFFIGRINFTNYAEQEQEDGLLALDTNLESTLFEQQVINAVEVPCNAFKLETRTGETIQPFPDYERVPLQYRGQIINKAYQGNKNSLDINDFFEADGETSINTWSINSPIVCQFGFSEIGEGGLKVSEPSTYMGRSSVQETGRVIFEAKDSGRLRTVISCEVDISLETVADTYEDVNMYLTLATDRGGILSKTAVLHNIAPDNASTETFIFEIDTFNSISKNDSVYLSADLYINPTLSTFLVWEKIRLTVIKMDISFVLETNFQQSLMKGMFPWELFNRVINFITGEPNRVIGDIISRPDQTTNPTGSYGDASKTVIIPGYGIRNFPEAESELVVNLQGLVQSFKYAYNIGLGFVEDEGLEKLLVADIESFYTNDIIMTITEGVKEPKVSVDSAAYWAALEVGYVKYKIEDRNFQNTQEFNTRRTYFSDVEVWDKTEKLLCPYIGSGHGIEYQRRDPYYIPAEGDNPDEKRFDDDKFLLCASLNDAAQLISSADMNNGGVENLFLHLNEDFYEYGQTSWGVVQNDLLYESGEVAYQQIEPKITPFDSGPPNPYHVKIDYGGRFVTVPQSVPYQITVTIDITIDINNSFQVDSTNKFILYRASPTNALTVMDQYNVNTNTNHNALNIVLTATYTVDPTDPVYEWYYNFEPSLDAFPTNHMRYYWTENAAQTFTMSTNTVLIPYKQESDKEYFGSGVVVSNMANPDTSVNYRISPRQAMERHKKTLSQVNYRLNSQFMKFGGERVGNIFMSTTNPTFAENEDVSTAGGSLYLNEILECTVPWGLEESKMVEAMRYGRIIIDTDNITFDGYIETIEHRVEEGIASLRLKRKGTYT